MPIAAGNGRRPLPALWADPVMGSRRRALALFPVHRRAFALHNMTPCVPVGSASVGRSQAGTNMLETFFPASKMPNHLRSGPSGPYLDSFSAALGRLGYSADMALVRLEVRIPVKAPGHSARMAPGVA